MPPPDEALADAASLAGSASAPADLATRGSVGRLSRLDDVTRAYIDQSALGYMVYLLGSVSAFLAGVLVLSDAQAGLHSSSMALGMIAAGLAGPRLDGRFGARAVHLGALATLALATLLIAWAPAFAVTIVGAGSVGIGCGLLLSHVNRAVAAVGGVGALLQLTRAAVIGMLSSVTVPVFIGLGVALGIGWQFVAVPALLLIAIAGAASWQRSSPIGDSERAHGRLPRAFWLPWLLVALVVCVEFGVLFWAATMVERSTRVSLPDATLTISVFLAGAVLARTMVSIVPALSRIDPIAIIRFSLVLACVGTLAVWASPSYELSVAAMLLGGVGLGVLYPVTAAVTLATARSQQSLASARLVLATAVALLVSPFVLGLAADLAGVATAWLLIPVLCLASLLLTLPLARARGQPLPSLAAA